MALDKKRCLQSCVALCDIAEFPAQKATVGCASKPRREKAPAALRRFSAGGGEEGGARRARMAAGAGMIRRRTRHAGRRRGARHPASQPRPRADTKRTPEQCRHGRERFQNGLWVAFPAGNRLAEIEERRMDNMRSG